ncbi:MAG: magnesium transporter [Halieaceae bacterium]|jgi:magnesium transporter
MIRAMLFLEDQVESGGVELLERWRDRREGQLWLDIDGEIDEATQTLLLSFGCNELAITDASRRRHPPKLEVFAGNSFILYKGIASMGETLEVATRQLALFLGEGWLITIHAGNAVTINHHFSHAGDFWTGNLATFTLALLNGITGRYLEALLAFEDRLGDLEEALLSGSAESAMRELATVRSRLRILRRTFSYHERLGAQILAGKSPELGEGAEASGACYHERRDFHDRCERVYSLCSMYYEICGDLIESYISISSHQLNNTMKVLTIITAVFVPLSFMAGLYGMNFDHMPELHMRYAYYVLLGVMLSLATAMLYVFRRVRWL